MKLRDDRGAAAVELALVLPILLMLLFGVIEGGRYYNAKTTLTHASREGARVLALQGTAAEATARVAAVTDGLAGVVASTTACPSSALPSDDAVVEVSMPFTFQIPFASVAIPGGSITSRGVMRCGG